MKKFQIILATACTLLVTNSYAQHTESITTNTQASQYISADNNIQSGELTFEQPADWQTMTTNIIMGETETSERLRNTLKAPAKIEQVPAIEADNRKTTPAHNNSNYTK